MFANIFFLIASISCSVPIFYRKFSDMQNFNDFSDDFYGSKFLREVNPIQMHRQRVYNILNDILDDSDFEGDMQKPEDDDESFLQLLQLLH